MPPVAKFALDIDAPIATVWQAMVELRRYAEWNPFIVAIETDDAIARVGSQMKLDVRWGRGGGTRSPEVVSRVEPPALVNGEQRALLAYEYQGWPARLRLVLGTRLQTVTQAPGAPTRYETYEAFHGLLGGGVPLAKVQDGFERHARALKQRAESTAKS
jgi:uncharacterized protein YndB with AHSA1/START domain